MKISTTLFYYLIFTNLVGFLLMGRDKQRAKARKWRIPERTLFLRAEASARFWVCRSFVIKQGIRPLLSVCLVF